MELIYVPTGNLPVPSVCFVYKSINLLAEKLVLVCLTIFLVVYDLKCVSCPAFSKHISGYVFVLFLLCVRRSPFGDKRNTLLTVTQNIGYFFIKTVNTEQWLRK